MSDPIETPQGKSPARYKGATEKASEGGKGRKKRKTSQPGIYLIEDEKIHNKILNFFFAH